MDIRKIKEQMCEFGRRMYEKGYVAANDGNISVRIGDGRYLCTPTGVSKGFLKPEDIAVVDDEGRQLEGTKPRTSEIFLHLQIFHELSEVNAVCHAHPPHATAFAVAGVEPPLGVLPEVEIWLGRVPLAPYETPGGKDFARTVLPYLRDKANTILLGNHGAVACDKDLEQAYFHLETLDMYCQILLLSRQVGNVRQIPENKVRELLDIKKRLGLDDPRLDANAAVLAGSDDFLKGFSTRAIPQHAQAPDGTGHGQGIGNAPSQRDEPQPLPAGTRLADGTSAPLPAIVAGRKIGTLGSSSETARRRVLEDEIERLTQLITDRILEQNHN